MMPARVLLVEDDRATRVGYAEFLARNGYEVIPVGTGHDGLTAALTLNPDIIVLDLGLPDLDGWEVARRLRSSAAAIRVPVIAVTAADLPHERISAMRAGCDRHLAKPCAPSELIAAIRQSLDEGDGASPR